MLRFLCALFCLGLGAAGLAGCGGTSTASSTKEGPVADAPAAASADSGRQAPAARPINFSAEPSIYGAAVQPVRRPIVVLHTTAGDIHIELETEKAPRTVANFLDNYVNTGFYEGTIFHHVEPGAFVAAGGYTAELEAKPPANPIHNEARNGLSNSRGTVAMARDPFSAHSATCQFFINTADNPDLDYRGDQTDADYGYCVFGRVVEGMEIVDRLAKGQTTQQGDFPSLPAELVRIESVEQLR
jgi:cyclophilin family peptidyl-prolyl cis-trans isomerase